MKYIYIVNGRPDKAAQYQDFYDQLKLNPHPYEVYTTLGEGDATRYVRLFYDRDTQDPLEGQITKPGGGYSVRQRYH